MSEIIKNLKPILFYHLQQALNLFWQNQTIEKPFNELTDKVFLIEDTKQKLSAYLIFSANQIQIYPEYQEQRVVNIKISFDLKEVLKIIFEIQKNNPNTDILTKRELIKDGVFNQLKINGDAYLAKALLELIEQLDFNFKPYIKAVFPNKLKALINQLPLKKIATEIKKQTLGTLNNLKDSKKESQN